MPGDRLEGQTCLKKEESKTRKIGARKEVKPRGYPTLEAALEPVGDGPFVQRPSVRPEEFVEELIAQLVEPAVDMRLAYQSSPDNLLG